MYDCQKWSKYVKSQRLIFAQIFSSDSNSSSNFTGAKVVKIAPLIYLAYKLSFRKTSAVVVCRPPTTPRIAPTSLPPEPIDSAVLNGQTNPTPNNMSIMMTMHPFRSSVQMRPHGNV